MKTRLPLTMFYECVIAYDKWFIDSWPIPGWLRDASQITERSFWKSTVDPILIFMWKGFYVDVLGQEYYFDLSRFINEILLQDKKRYIYCATNDYSVIIGKNSVRTTRHRVRTPIVEILYGEGNGWLPVKNVQNFDYCVRCTNKVMTLACNFEKYVDVSLTKKQFSYFDDGKDRSGFNIVRMVEGEVTVYEFSGTGQRIPYFKRNAQIVSLCGYHNLIKGELLNACSVRGTRHLDFCCGRGGDFQRIVARGFRVKMFLDRDFYRIEEFYARYHDANIDATLLITNDFSECMYDGRGDLFDSVSCNFGIQFFFENKDVLFTVMSNMYRLLTVGGSFFGLFPMQESMVRYTHSKNYFNNYFKVQANNKSVYGNEVIFNILDTDTTLSPYREYAVSYREFFRVATEIGFSLQKIIPNNLKKYLVPFHDWYVLKGQGQSELRDLSSCYSVFWFVKTKS